MKVDLDKAIWDTACLVWFVGGIALATSYFVMLLWNGTIPEVFGLKPIGFWTAFRLQLLVAALLQAGFRSNDRR